MATRSEQKANRRELLKAIAHTYIKLKGGFTAKELEFFINENKLMHRTVSHGYISNILGRATTNSSSRKRFKSDNGVWNLNL